jgi:hypothetical protein
MRVSKLRPGRMAWSFISGAVACLASGTALAQVSTTSAYPMFHFVVVQPIDVCTDNPRPGVLTDCAYINNSLQTVLSSPTGANTLVGFIDPVTGMQSDRNIWSAYGIDVKQTPVVQYNSTASQTLKVNSCDPTSGTTNCTSPSFKALAQQVVSTAPPPTAISQGVTPTFPRNPNPTVINRFFVKNICSSTNTNCFAGDVDGFGSGNGNGFATQNRVFFPQLGGKPDTDAHELGHNLALDHLTFGAADTTNLMTAGGMRTIPTPIPATGSKMDMWVLQVSPNASAASMPPALDQLTVPPSGACLPSDPNYPNCPCTSIKPSDPNYPNCTQRDAAWLSGFLNVTPAAYTFLNVPEAAALSVQTAAARSNSTPPPFEIDIVNTGAVSGVSLAEMIIVLTQGKFDNSSGDSLTILEGEDLLAGRPEISHGNKGNGACAGQGPGTWCLDLRFVPGAYTGGPFNFTIGTKPTDPNQLQGAVCYFWESSPGVPYYNSCSDLHEPRSQNVNLAINPLIPLNFAGTPGNKPCTSDAATCPDPTYIYPSPLTGD